MTLTCDLGESMEQTTYEAYSLLAEHLHLGQDWHVVRIWNLIPNLLRHTDEGMDLYMQFNAGRFRAFCDWFGGAEAFDQKVPAASGVGSPEPRLIVHVLASRTPGRSIANPRQVAPHRYSKRFGPLPPCFARATLVNERLLLVGGTASVRGEKSVHAEDLDAQLSETFENLAAVVATARDRNMDRGWAATFRDLRVYHVNSADHERIACRIGQTFPSLRRVEYVRTDLCRADLRVEIEGLAELE